MPLAHGSEAGSGGALRRGLWRRVWLGRVGVGLVGALALGLLGGAGRAAGPKPAAKLAARPAAKPAARPAARPAAKPAAKPLLRLPIDKAAQLITPELIRQHATALTEGALADRRLGTAGAAAAQRQVAEQLEAAGLKPGGDSGFLQPLALQVARARVSEPLALRVMSNASPRSQWRGSRLAAA